MTGLLVKLFVKDYQQTEKPYVRTRYGLMASVVGIGCNILLFVMKLLIGLMSHSISVMADAFNNLTDATSSIISFIGVKMAGKPADEEHPFGHGRMEYIAAFIVAFIVIQVGFSFFKSSILKIRNPEEMTFKWISVIVLLLSVGVKLWMAVFNKKIGKKINSTVMMAASADSMGDVMTTSATIISIMVYGIWNVNIDGLVGVVVSAIVMWAGINIAKDTLAPLIGEPIDSRIYEEITNFVESFDGIIGTHDLIVHNYGPAKSMASIHAEVPNDVNIDLSHEIIDRIEREALSRFNIVLVIHMDPVEMKNVRVKEFHSMVEEIIYQVDERLTFHDFRMVDGQEQIKLIFDLVIPREYKDGLAAELKGQIIQMIQSRDSRCSCSITTENSFCAEE